MSISCHVCFLRCFDSQTNITKPKDIIVTIIQNREKRKIRKCFFKLFLTYRNVCRFAMNRIRIHVLPSSRNRVTQTPRPQEPQACSFTQRPCSQPRLDGLDFCIKHILEDKNAPYKQCSYVSAKNGKRCPNAAPKAERKDG